jgi:dTDP-4-dehydrorhamnose 3,5-epimerase
MLFTETPLPGVWIIDIDRREDDRGWFARSFCQDEYRAHGLNPQIAQCNISLNRKKGTLRGMHYQAAPYAEAKTVRCTRGAIYDVALDLRPDSPTFLRWFGLELTGESCRMLYILEGLAHGFQSLTDDSEVLYEMSEFYHPEASRGVRWDDPAFGITWPLPDPILSDRDRAYPDWKVE